MMLQNIESIFDKLDDSFYILPSARKCSTTFCTKCYIELKTGSDEIILIFSENKYKAKLKGQIKNLKKCK